MKREMLRADLTWLVWDGDSGSRVASQFGTHSWVTEIHDKLFDLLVVQQAVLLPQLQQTNGHIFLGLARTIVQVTFYCHVVLKKTQEEPGKNTDVMLGSSQIKALWNSQKETNVGFFIILSSCVNRSKLVWDSF